mmetsp:Transcript_19996/g.45390  ORF Transcript_19996/g.45390 Transcript_19996/m.45390 type:complete len:334 (-) Transcript_19996:509-1510(-)
MTSTEDDALESELALDSFTIVLFASAILYVVCLCVVQQKLRLLHRRSVQLDSRKLFVMGVWMVCIVRILCFVMVGALNLSNVKVNYIFSGGGTAPPAVATDDGDLYKYRDHYQDFYEKAVAVLFDVPNYLIVSTYMLLALIWVEVFVKARFHTFKDASLRKKCLVAYMSFNILLYGGQTLLYVLLFLPGFASDGVVSVFYVAGLVVNMVVVALVAALYLYLSVKLAGFPFRSPQAQEFLKRTSRVALAWTLARLAWALSMLFVSQNEIPLEGAENSLWSLLLFVLFLLCEVAPIFLAVDYSLLGMFDFDQLGEFVLLSFFRCFCHCDVVRSIL